MTKICLDPGHNQSGADTGAQGNGMFEQDLTLDIALRIKPLLEANGYDVVLTREGDFVKGDHQSVKASLESRAAFANREKADLFVSIHVNAGGGTGTEIFVLPGGSAQKCAQRVLDRLIEACKWSNRGVKTNRNFYVLVYTDMPAILTENGFIDHAGDAQKLRDPDFRQKIALGHAKGICDFYGKMYLDPNQKSSSKVPILGKENVTVEQCQTYLLGKNPDAPNIVPYYEKYGTYLGIKWGYAVAQMMHETNYLKYGGNVLPSQYNYAGLGATGKGERGASFATQEEGVLAHLEHLYAYATNRVLPTGVVKVDPRFDLVSRGSCPNWQDLDGHWAVPGIGYGDNIIRIHDQIAQVTVEQAPAEGSSTQLLKKILDMLLDFFKQK